MCCRVDERKSGFIPKHALDVGSTQEDHLKQVIIAGDHLTPSQQKNVVAWNKAYDAKLTERTDLPYSIRYALAPRYVTPSLRDLRMDAIRNLR